jgi:predicted RNA-binding Zn ribbon-like protein
MTSWRSRLGGSVTASPRGTPPPFFVGEHPALDFLNTVATPALETVEWIGTGEAFLSWLGEAKLVSRDAAELSWGRTGRRLDAVAARARALREWFRRFIERRAGRPLAPNVMRALAPLNHLLARDAAYAQLEAVPGAASAMSAGQSMRWRWERQWRRPELLLQPVAHAMGDLVCHADFSYVRRCERCTLWFLDVSRGHQRRWCSMALCGNRAKAEAYRQR